MSKIFINNSELNLAKAEKKELHGRNWIVAPMTMLREGIYNGSGGPIFYPAAENKKSAKSWNHMPIVINHPQDAVGNFISARTPDVLEERSVGMVLATNATNGDLKSQAWFDILRLEKVEPQLLQILNEAVEGTPTAAIEVSTGLHLIPKEEVGVWNSLSYSKVASSYEPDHLAVLLNTKGSCTVEAGCGLFVNTQEELDRLTPAQDKQAPAPAPEKLDTAILNARRSLLRELSDSELVANEACFSEIEEAIRMALRDTDFLIYDSGWIEAVFVEKFIFRFRHKFYMQAYKMEGAVAKLVGAYKEVTRRVEYDPVEMPVVANSSEPGTNQMDKTKLIAAILTTNGSGWTEADKPTLEGMSDAVLAKIHANVTAKTAVANSVGGETPCGCTGEKTPAAPSQIPAPAAAVPAAPVAPAPVANAAAEPNGWWNAIPADKQLLINDALTMMDGIRNTHIQTILSAPDNKLTANTLTKLSTDELVGMSTLVANSTKASQAAAAAVAEAQAAKAAAAQAAQNQIPFVDYRLSAPAPITNAANNGQEEAPKHTPLKMLSTFSGN